MSEESQQRLEQSVGFLRTALNHWQLADYAYDTISRLQEDETAQMPLIKFTVRGPDDQPIEAVLDMERLPAADQEEMLEIMSRHFTSIYTRRLSELAKYSSQANKLIKRMTDEAEQAEEVTDDQRG